MEDVPPPRQTSSDLYNSAYAEGSAPPWDIGHPQPAFLVLARSGELRGRVLDIGCGTGEHALMAAELGLDATGIDVATRAILLAEQKAKGRKLAARFVVGDVLVPLTVSGQFDTVLDCGLFHLFDDDDRAIFVRNLTAIAAPGGRYFMLCFSDQQPGDWGPRRVGRTEIESSFADGWRIDSIVQSTIEITLDPDGARAWLVSATRIAG